MCGMIYECVCLGVACVYLVSVSVCLDFACVVSFKSQCVSVDFACVAYCIGVFV